LFVSKDAAKLKIIAASGRQGPQLPGKKRKGSAPEEPHAAHGKWHAEVLPERNKQVRDAVAETAGDRRSARRGINSALIERNERRTSFLELHGRSSK